MLYFLSSTKSGALHYHSKQSLLLERSRIEFTQASIDAKWLLSLPWFISTHSLALAGQNMHFPLYFISVPPLFVPLLSSSSQLHFRHTHISGKCRMTVFQRNEHFFIKSPIIDLVDHIHTKKMFYQKFIVNTGKSLVKLPGNRVKTNNLELIYLFIHLEHIMLLLILYLNKINRKFNFFHFVIGDYRVFKQRNISNEI